MIQTIKQIALDAVKQSKPIQFYEATVTKAPPNIEIRLKSNANLLIPKELIIIPEHLTRHKKTVDITSSRLNESNAVIEFKNELKVGDRIMVVALQGGQSFFIIDRIS